jgi:ubiquinone/menaquinone biosynthesis C-methylase UbiE
MSKEVFLKEYYENYDEDGRLERIYGQVEYNITKKYIDQYITKDMKILEVGAGTGRYAVTLAEEGYDVTAVELIEHNLNILKSKITDEHTIEAIQGNALDLSRFEDESFDVTLVLGPLYHLYTKEDQNKAIQEAMRVTRKGGKVMIAFITHDSVIVNWGFLDGNIKQGIQDKIVTDDFKCKIKPELLFVMFHVQDFKAMMQNNGCKTTHLIGTDGITNFFRSLLEEMDQETFDAWMDYQYTICEREDLIGYSSHVLYIGEK